jgi:hypothetical protein
MAIHHVLHIAKRSFALGTKRQSLWNFLSHNEFVQLFIFDWGIHRVGE